MKALIVVDIQYDFLPGGALAVMEGDQIIQIVNKLMDHFDIIVATQDWHPASHKSFASNHSHQVPGNVILLNGLDQVLWPDHCIQNSEGAKFHNILNTNRFDTIVQKGLDILIDSYSGFFDNGKKSETGLKDYLIKHQVKEVYIVGLAADFCVKYTAIDAVELGFKTFVVADATKAVNLHEGDFEKSMQEMQSKGIEICYSNQFLG